MKNLLDTPTTQLTLDGLPMAVHELTSEFREFRRLYFERENHFRPETDKWFNLKELCEYLPDKPKKATVYSWVSAGSIPVHKSSKKLRFLKTEIDSWLLQGRKKTLSEIASEAEAFLHSNKKGGKR